jgi:hypothetical protein
LEQLKVDRLLEDPGFNLHVKDELVYLFIRLAWIFSSLTLFISATVDSKLNNLLHHDALVSLKTIFHVFLVHTYYRQSVPGCEYHFSAFFMSEVLISTTMHLSSSGSESPILEFVALFGDLLLVVNVYVSVKLWVSKRQGIIILFLLSLPFDRNKRQLVRLV